MHECAHEEGSCTKSVVYACTWSCTNETEMHSLVVPTPVRFSSWVSMSPSDYVTVYEDVRIGATHLGLMHANGYHRKTRYLLRSAYGPDTYGDTLMVYLFVRLQTGCKLRISYRPYVRRATLGA